MTDNIESLIIEQLKAIRNDVREFRQVNTEEHSDIKARLASLESAIVSVKRNEADTSADIARQQISIDIASPHDWKGWSDAWSSLDKLIVSQVET